MCQRPRPPLQRPLLPGKKPRTAFPGISSSALAKEGRLEDGREAGAGVRQAESLSSLTTLTFGSSLLFFGLTVGLKIPCTPKGFILRSTSRWFISCTSSAGLRNAQGAGRTLFLVCLRGRCWQRSVWFCTLSEARSPRPRGWASANLLRARVEQGGGGRASLVLGLRHPPSPARPWTPLGLGPLDWGWDVHPSFPGSPARGPWEFLASVPT